MRLLESESTVAPAAVSSRSSLGRLKAHIEIARPDHIVKNVFVLPGILIPLSFDTRLIGVSLVPQVLLGLVAVCLVACSNYVINELLDAPYDRFHPTKRNRPVPSGKVNISAAWVQWLLMFLAGVVIGWQVSQLFAVTLGALWLMGIAYNVPPIRTKDIVVIDVMSEAANNPLRMLLGWFMVTTAMLPPVSLLVAYWMVGCYFMALKRFSEHRELHNQEIAVAYRRSLGAYTERTLLVSVMFYAATAMLCFGAFIVLYRLELALSFPLVAMTMALYLDLAFSPASPVQNPEKLYRCKKLMVSVFACAVAMTVLFFVDLPRFNDLFKPTLPRVVIEYVQDVVEK